MFYFVKTPWWLQQLYKSCVWQMPTQQKTIYLTFDDGPHPQATNFVLQQLQQYKALATFFCIGKNVIEQQAIYKQILLANHAVGNHTHNHLNGFKTANKVYMQNIATAKQYIDSNLFRPPYGRITIFQLKLLQASLYRLKPIMWTVLSGDFDRGLSPEKCLQNVIKNTKSGSIVVFHDSEKAFEKLQYVLPKVLAHFTAKGYRFEKIVL
jgi:peptidoglycan/xylan/chitin deacetylase (PgdA/CDA1 family)